MHRLDSWLLRHPWAALLIIAAESAGLYAFATRAPIRQPYDIGPTWIDQHIPYLWWSIPLYMTYYFVLPTFAWLNQHTPAFPRLWCRAFMYILCDLGIAVLIPTRVHPWALAEQHDAWARIITTYDVPLAAIPSAHVGLPCCIWLCSRRFDGRLPKLFGGWTAIFAVSILTTKQHYIWDLLAGLALAVAVSWFPGKPRQFEI